MRDNFILQVLEVSDLHNPVEIKVNDESNPTVVRNQHFEGIIKVRVRDYDGLPVQANSNQTLNENSNYFNGNNYQYSVEFQGNFKSQGEGNYFKASDILFGNQFEKKLRLPPFTSIGVKFIQWYDPGLEIDLYSDRPFAFSPLLVTLNKLTVKNNQPFNLNLVNEKKNEGKEVDKVVEDCVDLNFQLGDSVNRRKELVSKAKLDEIKIYSDTLIKGDFFNEYIDFNNRGIKLPLITVNVMQYWDNQPLDYVCKGKVYNDQKQCFEEVIFFVVRIHLVAIAEAFKPSEGSVPKDTVEELDVD